MKKIIIHKDFKNPKIKYKNFNQVKESMWDDEEVIITQDLSFFKFNTLSEGYEVIVKTKDNAGVVLSEMLKNPKKYTSKKIRRSHNVYRMLLAGAFKFCKV